MIFQEAGTFMQNEPMPFNTLIEQLAESNKDDLGALKIKVAPHLVKPILDRFDKNTFPLFTPRRQKWTEIGGGVYTLYPEQKLPVTCIDKFFDACWASMRFNIEHKHLRIPSKR